MSIDGEHEGLTSQDINFKQESQSDAETISEADEVNQALTQVKELYDHAYTIFDHDESRDSYLLGQGRGPGSTEEEMRAVRGRVDHFAMQLKQVEAIQTRMSKAPGPLQPQERELLDSITQDRKSTFIPGKPN